MKDQKYSCKLVTLYIKSVMIHDLQGRQVSFNKLESSQPLNTLDLSHFTSGLYIVSVRSRNQQLTQKIIIK